MSSQTIFTKEFSLLGVLVVLLFQLTVLGSNVTSKETKALETLRPLVADVLYKDYMKTDWYLLRWLRHAELDVNKAADLIKNAYDWRQNNKIDSLLDEDLSSLEKMFPYEMEGIDKEGRPVWINYFGKWDVRKMAVAGQIDEYKKFLTFQYEKVQQKVRDSQAKNPEKNVTQFILIVDLQGYNVRQQSCLSCIPSSIHFVQVYEKYNAGSLFKVYLINTPAIFEALMEVLRPFMSKQTRDLIFTFGYDQKEWQAELFKYIAPENLPTKLGGKRQTKN